MLGFFIHLIWPQNLQAFYLKTSPGISLLFENKTKMAIVLTDCTWSLIRSAWILTVCCCSWLESQCRRSVPVGPGEFWSWWQALWGTGTPIHTPLALFDHQGEQSVERTASIKQNILYSANLRWSVLHKEMHLGLQSKPHPSDPRRAGLIPPSTLTLALPGANSRAPATAHELWGCQTTGAGQEVLAARPSLGHLDHLQQTANHFRRKMPARDYYTLFAQFFAVVADRSTFKTCLIFLLCPDLNKTRW